MPRISCIALYFIILNNNYILELLLLMTTNSYLFITLYTCVLWRTLRPGHSLRTNI